MPNDVVAKPPADPSTGAGAERPRESSTPPAAPPEDEFVPPGPPDDGAAVAPFPPTPTAGLNRPRGRMALKIPDDAVPSRPPSPGGGPGLRSGHEGPEVSPLLGMRIIALGEGPLASPVPPAPKAEGRSELPLRGPSAAPPAPSTPPFVQGLEGARLGGPGARTSSIPPPPPPRPPAPAMVTTAPFPYAASALGNPVGGVAPARAPGGPAGAPSGAGPGPAPWAPPAPPGPVAAPGGPPAAPGTVAPGTGSALGAAAPTAPAARTTMPPGVGAPAAQGPLGGAAGQVGTSSAAVGYSPLGSAAVGQTLAGPTSATSTPLGPPLGRGVALSPPMGSPVGTTPATITPSSGLAGTTPATSAPSSDLAGATSATSTPLGSPVGNAPAAAPTNAPSPGAAAGKASAGKAAEGAAVGAARDSAPTPRLTPLPPRPASSPFLGESVYGAEALPPPRPHLPTRPWDTRALAGEPPEARLAEAPDEAEGAGLRSPLPSFPIDDEETDQGHEEALTTQPISSFPPAPPSDGPDIEVEVSVEDGPPTSEQAPPESEPEPIGTLSLDAEPDLAEAFRASSPELLAAAPAPAAALGAGPPSVEVEGPEVEASEADEADEADAEAFDTARRELERRKAAVTPYGEPESVEAEAVEAVEEDLDATQEMAALDLGAEDDAEEADEDELEEVDEAEVQSDPRARAREAPAPYASSVRLAGPQRGVTPPTPPARAGREEALDLRTKRRARPWWEELFDDDFLRATPRPTDAQIAAEASFIEGRLGLAKGALMLDLACGHGRHAIELTRRGYQVVGFDLSLAMLARAADEAEVARQKVNFLHGDMREMPFEDKFDGVYCWGTSFGFFEEEKNQALLQRVYRALRPGGVFLLETINRDFVAARQPSLVWYEGDGCLCMDEAQVDFITSRLKVKRTIMLDDGRTREVDYSMRLYGLHELGKMMHDAGFRVIEVSGRLATPGIFFGADSPQCIVLAERD